MSKKVRSKATPERHEHKQVHDEKNIAYHIPWCFRREAFRWAGELPIGVNFYPLGSDLRKWLLQQGQLSYFGPKGPSEQMAYSNPYTHGTSALALMLSGTINESHAFTKNTDPVDSLEVEAKCARLYNEQVLYTARICEGLMKQLLHCTDFPPNTYRRAALGALMRRDCQPCRKAGKPHALSLLGSLAHRYRLCLPIEHCLEDHMAIVNRRRNVEAAHATLHDFDPESAERSRARLETSCVDIGSEFVHMLKHIGDIESVMMGELQRALNRGLSDPWWRT